MPCWTRVFLDPSFIAVRAIAEHMEPMLAEAVKPGRTWLDVGCGTRPYEALFAGAKYVGVDVAESGRASGEKKPDVYYDGVTLPMEAASVDGILNTEVLEHVPDPRRLLAEFARVLKPGGALVLTAPFFWEQHEKPFDFLRFTEFSLRALLESEGFEVRRLVKSCSALETLAQGLSIYVSGELISRLPFGRRLFLIALCGPIQLLGLALGRLLPDRGDLYISSVVLAVKRA